MKTKKGFTLIELLIVIAIIGMLAAALLPVVLNAPARGRDAARLGHLNSIVAAIEAFNADYGHYPLDTGTGGCIGTAEGGTEVFIDDDDADVTNNYFAGGITPVDPSGNRSGLTPDPGGCLANGQYYYKHVGNVAVAEYIVATKMELASANNYAGDPGDISDTEITLAGTGDFYVIIK